MCTGTLDQRIVYEAARRGILDRQLPLLRAHYREKRDVMVAALRSELGDALRWADPRGGFFLWATLPRAARRRSPARSGGRPRRRLCRRRGVLRRTGRWRPRHRDGLRRPPHDSAGVFRRYRTSAFAKAWRGSPPPSTRSSRSSAGRARWRNRHADPGQLRERDDGERSRLFNQQKLPLAIQAAGDSSQDGTAGCRRKHWRRLRAPLRA